MIKKIVADMPDGEMKTLLQHLLDQTVALEKRLSSLERKKISQGKGLTDDQYITYLKQQFHNMDIDTEINKMEVWCNANGRVMSRKFIANWLIKNKPVNGNGKKAEYDWMKELGK